MNINKAMIYGNLTRDPEMRALPSGGNGSKRDGAGDNGGEGTGLNRI